MTLFQKKRWSGVEKSVGERLDIVKDLYEHVE